ncbi:MAG: FG-GAP repeat domain-containing protein, partial [Candidatus Bipolaricaulia bacterium]
MRRFAKAAGIGALACAGPLLVAIGDVPRQAPIDSHVIQSSPQRTFGTALGDVNGDDRLDALFAHGVAAGGFPNDVCLNQSDDRPFPTCTQLSSDRFLSGEVELGDVDGDDRLDAVIANNGKTSRGAPNQVCFNDDGFPNDGACTDVTDPKATLDVALGDLDGDGDLDAVFANSDEGAISGGGASNVVCLNRQSGADVECHPISSAKRETIGVALGDVDGDGDLDAVFANRTEHNAVCVNDDGFNSDEPCKKIASAENGSRGVALGDVDADGDPDAVFANGEPNWTNTICLNDGGFAARQPCEPIGTNNNQSFRVALGDVDADGDLDAVFANGGFARLPNTVCANQNGSFNPDRAC